MAVMYPSQLSVHTESRAERILFEAFERQLPSDYVVIHSKSWITADRKGRARKQGECDFILLHSTKGILFVEAKSGTKFYCSGLDEYWYCEEGNSFRNPLNQAIESQYAILKLLEKNIPAFNLPFNVALAFPEADQISDSLPINLLPSMVILGPDVRCIQAKVEAALSAFRPPLSSPAPKDSFKRIIDLLRGEFHITASLSATVGGLREQFFQLEKEQVAVLDFFEQNRRVIVEGCAGSGKTLIAIEKAARAVRGGKRVLMLCFNIPLAEAVRARAVERGIAVDIFHFHGLAEQVVRAAGGEFPRKGSEPKGFWNEGCAELLDAALPLFPGRYDCIIVDEAQDFVEDWWIPILKLLADENAGEFYIFLDPGQNIFGRKFEAPFDGLRITLNTNYRNTPAIAKWLNNVFQTGIKPNDRLDEGVRPVEIRVKDDQSELFEIKNIVDGLVNKEKLNPGQIVILGQHALKYSIFRDAPKIGKHPIIETALPIQDEGTIRYSSIYRFKGLEAECVILCGVGATPRKDIGENLKSLLLAGASRAKILLYILHRYQGSER